VEERGAELIVGRCAALPEEPTLLDGSLGLVIVEFPGRDVLP